LPMEVGVAHGSDQGYFRVEISPTQPEN
jgi:hypothetical protein